MELKTTEWEWLSLIMQGHAAFQLMASGIELKIFDHLEQRPMNLEEIQRTLNIAESPAKILMTGLTCLRLTEINNDGIYRNTPAASKYLNSKSEASVVDIMGWQKHIVYPGIVQSTECMLQNKNLGLEIFPGTEPHLYQRIAKNQFLSSVFQKAMSSLSRSTHNELLNNLDLAGTKHFVDAGGGDGTNCMAVAKKFTDIPKLTVFDQGAICKIASEKITQNSLQNRIHTWPGDLFETAFPEGMDTLLLSHMLTIWSPEQNIVLLKKAYAALPKNGKLIVFNMAVENDQSGPFSSALGSLYFLCIATGAGRLYTWKEFDHFIDAAGFKSVQSKRLGQAHGMWVAQKS